MKKLAIGCGVLLLLGMVGAGGASYYAYHKVSSAFAGFAELGSLPQIERSVKKPATLRAAAGGGAEPGPDRAPAGNSGERYAPGSAPGPTRSSTATGASSRRTA